MELVAAFVISDACLEICYTFYSNDTLYSLPTWLSFWKYTLQIYATAPLPTAKGNGEKRGNS